jgi:hypothetical protein
MSASYVKIVPLLDMHQLQIFHRNVDVFGAKTFSLVIFYNMLLLLLLLYLRTHVRMDIIPSRSIMA